MKSISVVTALLGLAAATPEKRRPGAACYVDEGESVNDRAACVAVVDKLSADPDYEFTISGGSYSLGCETECHAIIYPKNEKEITLKNSDAISDINYILDACANGEPFVGMWTVESSDQGRRTEITKYTASIC
ncbi:uncharacterized protein DNG_10223 [Cephalotrichum gorgonifer]|uniref:Uncharacterized protein n=1 Tax=Cephalotrichum gorgonifer TaxID=2041049 RepID=A0AAE8T002_9PEZI|nr:uncharacterized protein DNG_10223 [Cephalotrichum gorgonifer]